MIVLASTDSIRVVTSSANALHVVVGHAVNAAAAFTPTAQPTVITAIATTTVVTAPAATTTANLSSLSFRAVGGANTITVQFFNGTVFEITSVALAAGERLEYENGSGWRVLDAAGQFKTIATGGIAGHLIRDDGVDKTQRAALNFTSTAFPGVDMVITDDAVNNESEVAASIAAMAANTIAANATAGAAAPTGVALAVQQVLIRSAANIVAVTAAAGQVLGRTAAGGNLGMIPVPGGLLRAPQILTATNATFAHPTGTNFLVVELVGGGGGGGGAAATAGAGGNGGNAGNYGLKTFTSISGTSNITIGAAGTVGSAAAGGNGGNSSMVHNAVTLTVPGGIGGALFAGAATLARNAANAGNAANTAADLSITGMPGQRAFRNVANVLNIEGGDGGSNPLGQGGFGNNFGALGAGDPGNGFGAGGGGAAAPSATAQTGGAATAGVAIVWEFG